MLEFKPSFVTAQALLAVINAQLPPRLDISRFNVEAYANGREHGYHIVGSFRGFMIGISFAGDRNNANKIVVYHGDAATGFKPGGNIPITNIFENASYFVPGAYKEAADFIIDKLLEAQANEGP